MTHLEQTATNANAGRGSSPGAQGPTQANSADNRDTQDPLYPPGLGFSPPLRPIFSVHSLGILGDVVVGHGYGSSLLDGPLVGLGLYGPAVYLALDGAHTTRILPAVCLGLPWPPVVAVEYVLHWPPQVALHEERMAGPGLHWSMLDDLDFGANLNLMPLDLERACAGFSCSICAGKAWGASGTCAVEPVDPEEYMDFTFLDEDDDPLTPSLPPSPYVYSEEDGSDLESLGESESASTLVDDGSTSSGSPPSPTASQRRVRHVKVRGFRADVTLGAILSPWSGRLAPGDTTEEALVDLFIEASERAPPNPELLWQPTKLPSVEEERADEDET